MAQQSAATAGLAEHAPKTAAVLGDLEALREYWQTTAPYEPLRPLDSWEWDLKRLVASVNVAGRDNGLDAAERNAAVMRCVGGYSMNAHSPSSSESVKRLSYIKEVDSVVSILEKLVPAECDLILGGDFNFTIGERQAGEFQSTISSEREVIRKIEQLGSSSCWTTSHPIRPLEQTLRWTSDQSPHRSTPFHCDGIFVPNRWKQRTTCEVFTSECYRISDHNPVVAWIED